MKNKPRLTIDDLLPVSDDDQFTFDIDRSGKPKIRKKKRKPVKATRIKYSMFFRLIGDNQFIPDPVEEYKFHPVRKWRVDICWPDQKLAVEIEGGVWSGGRHLHPTGFMKDKEKYNTLALMGYHLLRFTPQEMKSCESYDVIRGWFTAKKNGFKDENKE